MLHIVTCEPIPPPADYQHIKCGFGEIQLITRPDGVLLDLQSKGYNTMGCVWRQHSHGIMSPPEVQQLHDALGRFLAAPAVVERAA
jgi:hypothetical protein